MRLLRPWACIVALGLCIAAPASRCEPSPIDATVERIVAQMRASLSVEQMLAIDATLVERFIADADRRALGEQYWEFRANVPVVVSVMRHTAQATVPFWLPSRGFARTGLRVRNEEYEYEVWRKSFPAGRVGLGVNGFDKHRPHYFVCVGPERPGDRVVLDAFSPAGQSQLGMRRGSTIYHDWPDLVITELPDELNGQILLPTIRGRAREAHLIGGFRSTPHPSSTRPDQVMLTWSGDPRTTQTIQWRTGAAVTSGLVRWRAHGRGAWRTVTAASTALKDARLLNDPVVRRYTATLRGLRPGTSYEYAVGTPGTWSGPSAFRTAPPGSRPFSFVWLSDTHNRPDTASLLSAALKREPAAFCAITGDLVGTGQHRDDWDQLFEHIGPFARSRPIVPAIGNHDAIDGLGADLYLSYFGLPENGSPKLQAERSYSVSYGDALFVVLDCTDSVEGQTAWLERTLRSSRERWKFALFHFPPYALEEDYPDIRREWCPLFDRHGVDFVLNGHVHHLQRTKRMRAGRPAPRGPIYLMTVAVGQGRTVTARPPYADVASEPGPPLYHLFRVGQRGVQVECRDAAGKLWDSFAIRK